jgi:hypothetical protein
MNLSKRVLLPSILGLLLVFSLNTQAQWDKKPYAEWTEKESMKILNDSPWAKTQTFTSPGVAYNTGISGSSGIGATRSGRPPDRPVDALHVNFRVRFLSAKPIRQAASRLIEIKKKGSGGEELAEVLKNFASGEFLEYIIVSIDVDSTDPGSNVQEAKALLHRSGTANLKNNTFLEVKGGKRIFLQEFQTPKSDGLGARFIFPRMIDGKPFITPESEEIHFFTELSGTYKIDRRYRTKDMMYEGKFEY